MITVGNAIKQNQYNNMTFKAKTPPKMITVKAHSNPVNDYYKKELKVIQQQKRDRSLIEKLDPALVFERIKNEILIRTRGK